MQLPHRPRYSLSTERRHDDGRAKRAIRMVRMFLSEAFMFCRCLEFELWHCGTDSSVKASLRQLHREYSKDKPAKLHFLTCTFSVIMVMPEMRWVILSHVQCLYCRSCKSLACSQNPEVQGVLTAAYDVLPFNNWSQIDIYDSRVGITVVWGLLVRIKSDVIHSSFLLIKWSLR